MRKMEHEGEKEDGMEQKQGKEGTDAPAQQ
jgi:hypothetical protein